MTCCVFMCYYAQHSRPITDSKRTCERSCGTVVPLAAARAVIELQAAGLRLASARQLVAGLNAKSATLITNSNAYDNKLKRSINNYHYRCECVEGVTVKGGYPFMFISPFDLKIL